MSLSTPHLLRDRDARETVRRAARGWRGDRQHPFSTASTIAMSAAQHGGAGRPARSFCTFAARGRPPSGFLEPRSFACQRASRCFVATDLGHFLLAQHHFPVRRLAFALRLCAPLSHYCPPDALAEFLVDNWDNPDAPLRPLAPTSGWRYEEGRVGRPWSRKPVRGFPIARGGPDRRSSSAMKPTRPGNWCVGRTPAVWGDWQRQNRCGRTSSRA